MTNDEINQKIGEGFGAEPAWFDVQLESGRTERLDPLEFARMNVAHKVIREVFPNYCNSVDECLKVALTIKFLDTIDFTGSICQVLIWQTPKMFSGLAETYSKAFALALVKYVEARG